MISYEQKRGEVGEGYKEQKGKSRKKSEESEEKGGATACCVVLCC